MFPVNKNAIPKHAYEPSQTSDQPLQAQGKFTMFEGAMYCWPTCWFIFCCFVKTNVGLKLKNMSQNSSVLTMIVVCR